ncbi:MAG: hypothetical protein IPJ09_03195 [Saprospiraceae bacterium]|nr:hypothetical protein [Saprospiraceae bacterium]
MKSILYIISVIWFLFLSCKNNEPVFYELKIISFASINKLGTSEVNRDISELISSLELNGRLYIPVVTIQRVGVSKNLQLLGEITAGCAGDLGNKEFVDKSISKVLQGLTLPEEYMDDNIISEDTINLYFERLQRDTLKKLIIFDPDIQEDKRKYKFSNIKSLHQEFINILNGNIKHPINVIYKLPIPNDPIQETERKIIELPITPQRIEDETKNIIQIKNITRRNSKLDSLYKSISNLIDDSPSDYKLYLLRVYNRIEYNNMLTALRDLRSSAVAAISTGNSSELIRIMEIEKSSRLIRLYQNRKPHFQSILWALQEEDPSLIEIIKGELMKEGNSYILYLDQGSVFTSRTFPNYRISTLGRKTDGTITMSLYLPCATSENSELSINRDLIIGQAISGKYCNDTWNVNIVNESAMNKSFIKFRLIVSQ